MSHRLLFETLMASTIEGSNNQTVAEGGTAPGLRLSDLDVHLIDFPDAPPTTSGGFCELYVATYRPENLKLAMKRPKLDFPTDDVLRRFRREAEIWATFRHPNILPFFGTIKISHRLYIVSPWMSLGDLLSFVQTRAELVKQSNGRLDDSVSSVYLKFNEMVVVREIAAGLAYLHSNHVVHGDMKGKNVLLSDDGCAQICDFGLTKTLDHATTSTDLKGVGSIRWQSPELLRNAPKSAQSDVYAFGMTIAEVLTGNYPFPHLRDNSAVLFAIMIDKERPAFRPLTLLGVNFKPLWTLAARCWQTEVNDRPSMEGVLRELDQLRQMGPHLVSLAVEDPNSRLNVEPTVDPLGHKPPTKVLSANTRAGSSTDSSIFEVMSELDYENKHITFYTSDQNSSKVLKRHTQVVLTLTPVNQSELFLSQTPIAWKVINFPPKARFEYEIMWQPDIGFCTISEKEGRVLTVELGTHAPIQSLVQLEAKKGDHQWSVYYDREPWSEDEFIAVNCTSAPMAMALCSAEATDGPDKNWAFEPLLHCGAIEPSASVFVSPPVMLQAYCVSGYQENQLLSPRDKKTYILTAGLGKGPEPIDLRTLKRYTSFMLYDDDRGVVKLDLTWSGDERE